MDITPIEMPAKHTLFVSDNKGGEYTGQDTDYEALKNALQEFSYLGGTPKKHCLCKGPDRYKNCHGKSIGPRIKADLRKLMIILGEADRPA